jgi:hypothetical protein
MACLCGDLAFWEVLRVKGEHQMKGQANKRIEPMRGSAVRLALYLVACGALPLMAHPQRSAFQTHTQGQTW